MKDRSGRAFRLGGVLTDHFSRHSSPSVELLQEMGLEPVPRAIKVMLSKPEYRKRELEALRGHIEQLHAIGCKHVIVCDIAGSVHWDPSRSSSEKRVARLTEDGWEAFAEGLHSAGEMCMEYDMPLVYRHHVGTIVEKPKEIGKLMELTDRQSVHLLLDTAHAYYVGGDPLALLNHYCDRIKYLHLTDIRQSVLNQVREKSVNFHDSVAQGVFAVPGEGWIRFKPIIQKLNDLEFNGCVILGEEPGSAISGDPVTSFRESKRYIDEILAGIEAYA